jgi:CBS domain-containing protein
MSSTIKTRPEDGTVLVLKARTARDLMSKNPISLLASATLKEAAAFFTDAEVGAAPVANEAGRPVGVLSRTDLVRHEREEVDYLRPTPAVERLPPDADPNLFKGGFQVVRVDSTRVDELMTPIVYSVTPERRAEEVVRMMLEKKVHRIFVVDPAGVLIGVISAIDVLRHLE